MYGITNPREIMYDETPPQTRPSIQQSSKESIGRNNHSHFLKGNKTIHKRITKGAH